MSLERFERLAAIARRERPPGIDVTARVMQRIRAAPWSVSGESSDVALWLMTGASVLAASIVAAVAMSGWSSLMDPVSSFFHPLSLVIL